jgi:hypothetical protein
MILPDSRSFQAFNKNLFLSCIENIDYSSSPKLDNSYLTAQKLFAMGEFRGHSTTRKFRLLFMMPSMKSNRKERLHKCLRCPSQKISPQKHPPRFLFQPKTPKLTCQKNGGYRRAFLASAAVAFLSNKGTERISLMPPTD